MTLRILILTLLLAPLSACGVRGDLYLPGTESAQAGAGPARDAGGDTAAQDDLGEDALEEEDDTGPDGTGR